MSRFAMVTEVMLSDTRLSGRQFKVLCALKLFADTKTGLAHPKKAQIFELTGIATNKISEETSALAAFGWIEKTGNGGYSSPAVYLVFNEPKTSPEIKTHNQPQNGASTFENYQPQIGKLPAPKRDIYQPQNGAAQVTDHKHTNNIPLPEPLVLASPEEPKPETKKQNNPIQLATFFANCAVTGEMPIPDNDPIFEASAKTNIPAEFLGLCWLEFKDLHLKNGKRQKDWRATFRNCVRGEWYRLWYTDENGQVLLTSRGRAAQLRHRSAA